MGRSLAHMHFIIRYYITEGSPWTDQSYAGCMNTSTCWTCCSRMSGTKAGLSFTKCNWAAEKWRGRRGQKVLWTTDVCEHVNEPADRETSAASPGSYAPSLLHLHSLLHPHTLCVLRLFWSLYPWEGKEGTIKDSLHLIESWKLAPN